MQARAIEDSGVVETLDDLERLHAARTDAEARMFVLAAHFADLHSGAGLPVSLHGSGRGSRRGLPRLERAVQVGGEGTPRIGEFACSELGCRLQMSPVSARRYLADAVDVRHRLPLIWERVVAREARIGNARLVASMTRHLSREAAGRVDRAMVAFVDGSLPWGRFLTRLEGKIVAADPAQAAEREAARVSEQFAKRTRASEAGTAGFYLRSTVGVIARLDATVAFLADALAAFGDTECEDLRRVKAVAVLATPARAVELLAAFAALRSKSLDIELPLDEFDPLDQPEEPVGPDQPEGPADALQRMDAFARRVGFTPTR